MIGEIGTPDKQICERKVFTHKAQMIIFQYPAPDGGAAAITAEPGG
jgi:hypothetical protein